MVWFGLVFLPLQGLEVDCGRTLRVSVDFMCGSDEVVRFGLEDVGHLALWVAVDHWEPRALYMDHYLVALWEGVEHVLQQKLHAGRDPWLKGFGLFVAIAEAAPEDFAADQ
ncbi:MAG: hypothetical protein ACI9WU_001618 [Myxococcota bacterium]